MQESGRIADVKILGRNQRNDALDITRGFLVLSMVFYHALNYYYNQSILLYYIRYIGYGFVFVAGFTITNILMLKYTADKKLLQKKLVIRGLRIFLLFMVVNLLVLLPGSRGIDGNNIGKMILEMVTGLGYRYTSFTILLPIAYLFILTGLFLAIPRKILISVAIAGVIGALLMITDFMKLATSDAYYILVNFSYGITGLITGLIGVNKINYFNIKYRIFIIASFLLYIVLVNRIGQSDTLIAFGTFAILSSVYSVSLFKGASEKKDLISRIKSFLVGIILKLGSYSLFSYMAQIFILQIFKSFHLFYWFERNVNSMIAFIVTLFLTIVLTEATDFLNKRSKIFKEIYKIIF